MRLLAFGLIVPNGLFVYWLFNEYQGLGPVLQDRLALGFTSTSPSHSRC